MGCLLSAYRDIFREPVCGLDKHEVYCNGQWDSHNCEHAR